MAKSANVSVRVEPEIKAQAESILSRIGLPVSVLINSLYRQIIMQGGVPFSLNIPAYTGFRDTMSDADFNAMMDTGLKQAKANESVPLDEKSSGGF